MFKRATALFFILLAGFVLLAHAVIPHHQYQNTVCLTTQECKEEGDFHDPLVPEPTHKGNTGDSTENCVLASLIVISTHEETPEFKSAVCIENPSKAKIFQVSFLYSNLLSYSIPTQGSTFPLLIISTYSLSTSAIFGLRGPPVV